MTDTDIQKLPLPPVSLKNAFPFKLGTTSFIYPADYIPNVERIGPFVDEIELLMFESVWPESLPSEETVRQLADLGEELKLTYNIHLPSDVSLTDENPAKRQKAADTLHRFITRTEMLSPSAYALHLPMDEENPPPAELHFWQKNAEDGLHRLLEKGVDPAMLAVETLEYPFEYLLPLVDRFDLSICLDAGHLLLHDVDPMPLFEQYSARIPLMHLHGVRSGKDHLGLDVLSPKDGQTVMNLLKQFSGVVSLEVFSYKHLLPSLEYLRQNWFPEK